MEWNFKYSYSFDNEEYWDQYDSIEEALGAARADTKYYRDYANAKKVYVGRVYKYVPCVDAIRVIELMQDDAMDEAGDAAMYYLDDVKKEDYKKLEAMLTETFKEWAKETGNEPDFFTVENMREYNLEDSNETD